MADKTAKRYYTQEAWDVQSWVDVIAIEYEKLSTEYLFNEIFRSISVDDKIRLLDVGCGTAIFPGYLDQILESDIKLVCDLLDISEASLIKAREVISRLSHFEAGKSYQGLIEEIPTIFNQGKYAYNLIWAIHSFTTVDINSMPAVYSHLLKMLAEDGLLLVYQLAQVSSYQVLHSYYRSQHVNYAKHKPYMEFEDSVRILDGMGANYAVKSFSFNHIIEESRPDVLANYLKKVILDDEVEVMDIFAPIMAQFYVPEEKIYKFPQMVNLLEIKN